LIKKKHKIQDFANDISVRTRETLKINNLHKIIKEEFSIKIPNKLTKPLWSQNP